MDKNKVYKYRYAGTPFTITYESQSTKPDCWNHTLVRVYDNDNFIGEYIRRIDIAIKETFCPFMFNDEWYALYSSHYTRTGVAKLTGGFQRWCGEELDPDGFCPVEFYVPRYHRYKLDNTTYEFFDCDCDDEDEFEEIQGEDENYIETKYVDYGFLSGCYWGDDTSWKLRYIDLSKVADKKIEITEKFGYWELPNAPLRKCIHISGLRFQNIRINRMLYFNMKTNKIVE